MPNNGIVSTKTNIPDKFRATSINEFNNSTDMVVVNKALDGINVTQKSITLNQLAGLVGGGTAGPQGPMGPQGPAGPTSPAGLTWQGEYATETNYSFNDVVTWTNPDTSVLGSYWVTNESGVYNIPPTDGSGVINEGWAFLASQGPQGIQGVAGPQGEVGPQGPAGAATLPYKEMNLLIEFDNAGEMIITPGYSTFVGGISWVNHYCAGKYQMFLSSSQDQLTSLQKCCITSSSVNPSPSGTESLYNTCWTIQSPGGAIELVLTVSPMLNQSAPGYNWLYVNGDPDVKILLNIRYYN